MSELWIRGLSKRFGRQPVLAGLDLDVASGSVTAVLGPSGCGKTTLLRLIAGFERLDGGEIRIDDRVVAGRGTHVAPERREVSVVPQEGALFPHLDVAGNVAFGLGRSPRPRRRVEELLELVGMAGFQDRMPAQLSGGQQQRVALARALAPNPAVVLLDEPFAALDAGLRESLRVEVARALRQAGATAVLVTHDQEEALSTADAVAVMAAGVISQVGTPHQVYRAPVSLEVARFVGEAVELRGQAVGDEVTTVLGRLRLAEKADGAGVVVVRPEQLVVGSGGVAATVVDEQFFGTSSVLTLRVDGAADGLVVRARIAGSRSWTGGVQVSVDGSVAFFADGA